MRKDGFYKLVIVLLLLLNLGTLGYLLMEKNGKGHKLPPPPPDRIIIERLHLSEPQIKQFELLKHEHHSQMLDIQEQSGRLHRQLFELLRNDTAITVEKDSLLRLIQATNLQKEQVTFEHFRKLRKMLAAEQQDEFDRLVEDISSRIMGPHRK